MILLIVIVQIKRRGSFATCRNRSWKWPFTSKSMRESTVTWRDTSKLLRPNLDTEAQMCEMMPLNEGMHALDATWWQRGQRVSEWA